MATRFWSARIGAAAVTMRQATAWLLALLGAGLVVVLAVGVPPLLSLESLQAHRDALSLYAASHQIGAAAMFVLVFIAFAALALPGAEILAIAGGMLFGLVEGVVLVSFAAGIGATLAFLLSRLLLRGLVRRRFATQLGKVARGVDEEGAFYLFALRLIPVIPFFLVDVLMGLTRLPVFTFYWVSQIGMLPAIVAYVNAGERLGQIRSISDILSVPVLLSFAVLGLLPLASRYLVKAARARRGGRR